MSSLVKTKPQTRDARSNNKMTAVLQDISNRRFSVGRISILKPDFDQRKTDSKLMSLK